MISNTNHGFRTVNDGFRTETMDLQGIVLLTTKIPLTPGPLVVVVTSQSTPISN